jgi:hypothetical protein
MGNRNVITFDNLRQADNKIAGQTQEVKAIRPAVAERLGDGNHIIFPFPVISQSFLILIFLHSL